MTSQLLQSCRREAPSQPSPRGRCAPQPPQTQEERIPAPWGGLGRGLQSAVFLPPKAVFLNGQRPLFEPCRLLSSCKAWRWGLAATTRRKTCFPTAVTDSHKKGEADNSQHGFLCLYQPQIGATNYRLAPQINHCFLLRVTPSANRNSYRVAKHYYIFTQGRGATHLNPGL